MLCSDVKRVLAAVSEHALVPRCNARQRMGQRIVSNNGTLCAPDYVKVLTV